MNEPKQDHDDLFNNAVRSLEQVFSSNITPHYTPPTINDTQHPTEYQLPLTMDGIPNNNIDFMR